MAHYTDPVITQLTVEEGVASAGRCGRYIFCRKRALFILRKVYKYPFNTKKMTIAFPIV